MRDVLASAPGKVNLALLVGNLDASGYHPLTSVFEAISLREYVEIRGTLAGDSAQESTVEVRTLVYSAGPNAMQPRFDEKATVEFAPFDGPEHLAVRAVRLLVPTGVRLGVTVHKTLPIAGGMAGGSADAAATLIAVNEWAGLGYTGEELSRIGADLGADVPACMVGGLALGLGRGDAMTVIDPGTAQPEYSSRWWVAAFAKEGLSTPQVFRQFDALRDNAGEPQRVEAAQEVEGKENTTVSVPGESISPVLLAELQRPGVGIASAVTNDLAKAAFTLRPELRKVGSACMDAGAEAWILSGSGPTIIALSRTANHAREIAEAVDALPMVRETAVMWGPEEGARIEKNLPSWCLDVRG